MTISSFEDLYHAELQDMHSACMQAHAATVALGRLASDKALSEALIDGSIGISDGLDKLKSICAAHDIDPKGHHCKGMEGLAAEAKAHSSGEEFADPALRDAMIITQYQRMVHYALAGYGSLVAFANRLGHDGDGALLQECLDSTYDGDRRMTDIATSGINARAAA